MGTAIRVVQAFDRTEIESIAADDAAALEKKLALAAKTFRDRDGWLKTHQRSAILLRTAQLLETSRGLFDEVHGRHAITGCGPAAW